MTALNKQFDAILEKSPNKGGWTYVVMPGSAEYFGTRGDRVTVVLQERLEGGRN